MLHHPKEKQKLINEQVSKVINSLETLSLEEKIAFLFNSFSENSHLMLQYKLTGENFLCYAIAEQKERGKFTSIENAIKVEVECTRKLISDYDKGITSGIDSFDIVRIKENLKYMESLVEGGNNTLINNIKEFEHLSWKENTKTDLCELIYCLCKSNRILDNGIPISQVKLVSFFEVTFNVKLNRYHDLLREGILANKKTLDKKYFMTELEDFIKTWKPKAIK